jgi:hypothetical protein
MFTDVFTLIRMAIKKVQSRALGVIYDSQTTNRKQGGLSKRAHSPRVLPDSQPSETHKNIPTNRWKWKLLFFD